MSYQTQGHQVENYMRHQQSLNQHRTQHRITENYNSQPPQQETPVVVRQQPVARQQPTVNITPIDFLDLDDDDDDDEHEPVSQRESSIQLAKKKIRNSSRQIASESGMGPTKKSTLPVISTTNKFTSKHVLPEENDIQFLPVDIQNTVRAPTCLEIADHIAKCPICSKFYKKDSTVYIIAIVVLSLICILLLKRVLDI
jgi:hypothetical protein